MFLILFASLVFFVTNLFRDAHRFPIQEVKIFGIQHANLDAIQHSLIPLVSKGFFGVDVDAIQESLLQNPWIAQVSVRRVWPGQVAITISEHHPVASWNEHSLVELRR